MEKTTMEAPPLPPKKSHVGGIAAIIIAFVVIVIIVFFALTNLSFLTNLLNVTNPSTTTTSTTNSNLTIGYPPNYNTLVSYALNQINIDRQKNNVPNVTLSPILSGQQHAYSMLQNGYFSHWDVQGYKPYMRYTILNGTSAVEENVAYESTCSLCPSFSSTSSVEQVIHQLEYDMVYNDSACCQNGHLYNIINKFHNRVSIGIMYDSTHVYFVEDFENYYISLNTPIFTSSNESVQLTGSIIRPVNADTVVISYDPTPQAINASTLNSEYQKPYDEGTFLGGVIPCSDIFCTRFMGNGVITIRPATWQVTSNSIDIVFSLQKFIAEEGSGVYTIYLTQNTFANNSNNTASLTSISIFIQA